MAPSPALPPEIDQALLRGYLVLTANQRAARALNHAFDLHQRALGRAYWEPPFILAWDAWTESLWHSLLRDGHASDLLLSSSQEQTLWRGIIAADAATATLRPVDSLAQLAAQAWLLLHAYQGRRRLNAFPGNGDTRAFSRWATEFERRCARAQYLTLAQLPETLRAAVSSGKFDPPLGILPVGFDLITPAQTALLDALRAAGTSIDAPQPSAAPHAALVSAPGERDELAACAHWLRVHLTDHPARASLSSSPQSSPSARRSTVSSARSSRPNSITSTRPPAQARMSSPSAFRSRARLWRPPRSIFWAGSQDLCPSTASPR